MVLLKAFFNASSPLFSNISAGSLNSCKYITKFAIPCACKIFKVRIVAFIPAESLSNKIYAFSTYLDNKRACSDVKAVPREATA